MTEHVEEHVEEHAAAASVARGNTPLARMQAAVPDLWEQLCPMCRPGTRERADAVARSLRGHLAGSAHADHACELSNELLALHAGWDHFTPEQRAVLVGSMTYLATTDDASRDTDPCGLEDDDRVVRACVRVLLRPAA